MMTRFHAIQFGNSARRGTCPWITKTFPLLLVLLLAAFVPNHADGAELDESQVKALFLYNFTRYVSWPEGAFANESAPIVIGVAGATPVLGHLRAVAEADPGEGRPTRVVEYDVTSAPESIHILFVSSRERSRYREHLTRSRGHPVLTVGEHPSFTNAGGMIHFHLRDNRVRMAIRPAAARRENIVLSSQLLRLADLLPDNME